MCVARPTNPLVPCIDSPGDCGDASTGLTTYQSNCKRYLPRF